MKKKLVLFVVTAAFMFGCSANTTVEDPIPQVRNTVAGYDDACAGVGFADTNGVIAQIDNAMALNDRKEADRLAVVAQDQYNKDLAKYNQLNNDVDKAEATIKDQKSRLSAMKGTVDDGIYTVAEREINHLHEQAAVALQECDVILANKTLATAEDKLAHIKDVEPLEPIATTPTYTPTTTTPTPSYSNSEYYTVVAGDCLWKIAANKYSDPYFWPLIYWSNKDSIKDPDLIYPNQELLIEYNQGYAAESSATELSKKRGPWSLFDGK